ncbi:MAG: sulfatase [Bacteroidota bacterium]
MSLLRYFPLLLLVAFLSACDRAPESTPPNVLFLAVDDLRPEFGAFGRPHVHAPHLDALAASGTTFLNAYCNVPVCGASRASIMTGMRPTRGRFWDYLTKISEDTPGAVTLHGHFKAHGYYTAAMGKILHHPTDRSTDYNEPNWTPGVGAGTGRDYQTPENIAIATATGNDGRGPAFERGEVADTAYWDGKTAARAVAYLDRLAAEEQPFFLAVGFAKPHLPFNAPAKYWDMYDPAEIDLPPTYYRAEGTPAVIHHNSGELRNYVDVPKDEVLPEEYARQLIHGYYAATSFMDAQIGKVLAALEATGEADNTIVVLWGDHGWNLGDHTMWCKHTPFNTSLRVPLIVRAPGKEGGRTQAMTEFVDVFPTLCELAGLPLPEQLQGKSLVPLLDDPDREWSDAVFTRWKEADNITTQQYAYTEWRDGEGERYARVLFDHRTDSLEVNNLAELAEYEDVVAELAERLRRGQ